MTTTQHCIGTTTAPAGVIAVLDRSWDAIAFAAAQALDGDEVSADDLTAATGWRGVVEQDGIILIYATLPTDINWQLGRDVDRYVELLASTLRGVAIATNFHRFGG